MHTRAAHGVRLTWQRFLSARNYYEITFDQKRACTGLGAAQIKSRMDSYLPAGPSSFELKPHPLPDNQPKSQPKDWPHAPVHRLSEHGIYIVTAATLGKAQMFNTPSKLSMIEAMLLRLAKQASWDLEAWAVLSNHYHFVARGRPDSAPMRELLNRLHACTARELNELDEASGRKVWHNFWDTRLTHQHSYLARLKYVHQNAVKHGLVAIGNQYRWCSAAWFEREASPAQVKTIYRFNTDRLNVPDDF